MWPNAECQYIGTDRDQISPRACAPYDSFLRQCLSHWHPEFPRISICFSRPRSEYPDGTVRIVTHESIGTHVRSSADHVVPRRHDRLHVKITWEESHYAVWYNLAIFDQDAAKIADDSRVIPDFKTGTNSDLIASTSNDLSFA